MRSARSTVKVLESDVSTRKEHAGRELLKVTRNTSAAKEKRKGWVLGRTFRRKVSVAGLEGRENGYYALAVSSFHWHHVIQWYAMMPVPPQLEPGLSLRLLRPVTTTTSRTCFLRATHFQWQSMSLSLQCIVFTGAFGRSTDPKVFISLHYYDTGSMTDLFEVGKEGILL